MSLTRGLGRPGRARTRARAKILTASSEQKPGDTHHDPAKTKIDHWHPRASSAQRTRFQLRRPSEREGGVCCKPELDGSAQTRSTETRLACAASASRSSGSVVIRSAGLRHRNNERVHCRPRRALLRKNAARRARLSGILSTTSQVFSSWFSVASRPACPWVHSTRTTEGTAGGQSPSSRSARTAPLRHENAQRVG